MIPEAETPPNDVPLDQESATHKKLMGRFADRSNAELANVLRIFANYHSFSLMPAKYRYSMLTAADRLDALPNEFPEDD